jgi:DNA helicase-2/ATP-dependent DNA helicase PcrA
VNSPRRGIGQTSLGRVLAYAEVEGLSAWDAAALADRDEGGRIGLATSARRAIGRFMSTMERLRERAESGAAIGDLIAETLAETDYLEALKAERTIEAQGRTENLEELVSVAREYDATAEAPSLAEFLQQVALLSDADAIRDDEGLVTLMTLHNAKGLEFGIVFVIGCEDGVFPHARAMDEGNLEEERRLAYVAITRAMRDLYLTYARRRNVFGAQSYGMRSRFIDEIPRELTDQPAPGATGSPFAPGRVASWTNASAASAESERRETAAVFGVGDDVIHAQFGEGVVTGVEPGGIVAVRFADDGSERKLMADYAPIKRR